MFNPTHKYYVFAISFSRPTLGTSSIVASANTLEEIDSMITLQHSEGDFFDYANRTPPHYVITTEVSTSVYDSIEIVEKETMNTVSLPNLAAGGKYSFKNISFTEIYNKVITLELSSIFLVTLSVNDGRSLEQKLECFINNLNAKLPWGGTRFENDLLQLFNLSLDKIPQANMTLNIKSTDNTRLKVKVTYIE